MQPRRWRGFTIAAEGSGRSGTLRQQAPPETRRTPRGRRLRGRKGKGAGGAFLALCVDQPLQRNVRGNDVRGDMVPKRGLEPPRGCPHMALNHARLPVPPFRRPFARRNDDQALRPRLSRRFQIIVHQTASKGQGFIAPRYCAPARHPPSLVASSPNGSPRRSHSGYARTLVRAMSPLDFVPFVGS